MSESTTARPLVTAAEWFDGGQRIAYEPRSGRVLTEEGAAATPGVLARLRACRDRWTCRRMRTPCGSRCFPVSRTAPTAGRRWTGCSATVWSRGMYVEPVGQGDSDKPRKYRYSTVERADLVQALWRHHGVLRTVVVTFDYTSLTLLELLRRQLEGTMASPRVTAALMVNGGLFADAHTHPWRTTPMLRTPLGALGMRRAQRSPRVFDATILQAHLYSRDYHPTPGELAELRSAITRRDGAAFLHLAAGFTAEHRRHPKRWDLAAIARDLEGTVALYVGGSDEDPYEHRQIQAARERVPEAKILTFPGGHMTTSEHPDLLAAAISDIAERHCVATPAAASQ